MVTISPIAVRASSQAALTHSPPPGVKPQEGIVDSVVLADAPAPTTRTVSAKSPSLWLAVGAGLALVAAAAPAFVQVAPAVPQTSIEADQGQKVSVQAESPLAKGQLEAMQIAAKSIPDGNSRVDSIKQNYTELVELVRTEAAKFTAVASQLQGQASLDYTSVEVLSQEGFTRISDGQRVLIDTPDARTVISDGVTRTLFLRDGLFHEAGDFLIHLPDATVATSQVNLTRIDRLSEGRFERFEEPEASITIWPGPVFSYETHQGKSELSVTVLADGSAEVRHNGSLTIEGPSDYE